MSTSGETLKHKTMIGMVWVGIQRFGSMFVSFISNIVLARLLTPDDFGYIGMLLIFIAVSTTFIDGGFGSALIQKKHPSEEDYSTVFYWNIGLSVFLYLLLYFGAPLVSIFYKMPLLTPLLRVQGLILILNAVSLVQLCKLRKKMQFKIIALVNLISAIISVIAAIIYAYYGGGVWALVLQQLLQSALIAVFLWIICKWHPLILFSRKSFRELFSFGSFILISNLLSSFANNFRGLLIGKAFNASTLGYFSQAQKVENVFSSSLASVVEQVTYPLMVEVKDSPERMKSVQRQFNNAILSVVMPIMYLLCLLAYPIIEFLFTNRWIMAAPILQILSIQGIFICVQGTSYNVIASLGKSRTLFNWSIIKSLTGLSLALIGLYLGGLYGVLWSMVLGSCMIVVYNFYLVSKFTSYTFWSQVKDIYPIILLSTIPFLITFAYSFIMKVNNLGDIILGCLYIGVYVLVIIFSPAGAIRELRNNLMSVLKRK